MLKPSKLRCLCILFISNYSCATKFSVVEQYSVNLCINVHVKQIELYVFDFLFPLKSNAFAWQQILIFSDSDNFFSIIFFTWNV